MPVRYPRVWLSINGEMIPCLKGEANRKSQRASDTFSATLSITAATAYGMQLADWADMQPVDAALVMSMAAGASDQRVMVTGKIDMPSIDLDEMTVEVHTRDKSSLLIDKKRNEKKVNQKSSDIVAAVAADHGLSASVVDSGDPAGKKYDQDTVHLALNRSDFALVSGLADREGYRWYVDGDTLYFEPQEQDSDVFEVYWIPPSADNYAEANAIHLTLGRNMTAARPHQVTVKSWHHRDKKLYTSTSTLSGVGDPIIYEHHHNGHSQAQIDKIAKSRLNSHTRHELQIEVRMPADLSVDVRQKLQLFGTGTIYDQLYDIDDAKFAVDWGDGGLMTLGCKAPKAGRS